MDSPVLSNTIANTFDFDFKAEVAAAVLVGNGTQRDELMIVSLGARKRSYRKDVDDILQETSDYNSKAYTIIATHKEGIYDMLPEGLFHAPTAPKTAISQKEIIDDMKRHRTEERNARRFFLPYEAGMNQLRVDMALYESRIDNLGDPTELVALFRDHWPVFRLMDERQAGIFLHVLPLLHQIRDDFEAAGALLEMLFLTPVCVRGQRQHAFSYDPPIFSTLRNTRLGIDLTTGNSSFDDGEEEVLITIGPISNEKLDDFDPLKRHGKLLELVCDYLVPAHLQVRTDFVLQAGDKAMRLELDENSYNATLGFSTYLQEGL